MTTCSVDDCTAKHFGRGLCQKHYSRERRTGDVHGVRTGHRYSTVDFAERLAARTVQQGECLVYVGGHETRSGHVMVSVNGAQVGVHRAAYELHHAPITDDRWVLHHCDVPRCVRREHLYLGDAIRNNLDRDERGRHRPLPGSANGNASLTEDEVHVIKALLLQGAPQARLAAAFGVTQGVVQRIGAGQAWRHVDLWAGQTVVPAAHREGLAKVAWPTVGISHPSAPSPALGRPSALPGGSVGPDGQQDGDIGQSGQGTP